MSNETPKNVRYEFDKFPENIWKSLYPHFDTDANVEIRSFIGKPTVLKLELIGHNQETPKGTMNLDERYREMFAGTNFGTTEFSKLIKDGLEKVACGWWNGATLQRILEENGYIEARGSDLVLTDRGLSEMYSLHDAGVL